MATRPQHRKKHAYQLFVCVDFPDDLVNAPFDEQMLDKLFRIYRDWGVSRIYWMYTLRHAEHLWAHPPSGELDQHMRSTRAQLGEFLPGAVRAAHRLGLELYAVCKPLDLGINWFTHPFGTAPARREGRLNTLSGAMFVVADGVVKLQNLRSARNPADLAPTAGRPVAAIRLTARGPHPGIIPKNRLTLLVSRDNRRYIPYDQPYRFRTDRRRHQHVIVLDKLHITWPYIALRCSNAQPRSAFSNTLERLVTLADERGEPLPFTYGLTARAALQGHPETDQGYLFDWDGGATREQHLRTTTYAVDNPRGTMAMARGKEPYIAGALSPAYPRVRAYWLKHVRECLAAGVDGVDIRAGNHNRCLEWEAYGFEPPVVKAYKQKHGIDITKESGDRQKQRDLIGAYYTEYCRQASRLIRAAGKKVQMHIGRQEVEGAMNLTFEWEKWIQEGLMDEITLMVDYPSRCHRQVARLSESRKIPVYFRKYMKAVTRRPRWQRMLREYLASSKKLGQQGFILYESAFVTRARADGTIQVLYPDIPHIIRRAISRPGAKHVYGHATRLIDAVRRNKRVSDHGVPVSRRADNGSP